MIFLAEIHTNQKGDLAVEVDPEIAGTEEVIKEVTIEGIGAEEIVEIDTMVAVDV
jgi:hypothetical protein